LLQAGSGLWYMGRSRVETRLDAWVGRDYSVAIHPVSNHLCEAA